MRDNERIERRLKLHDLRVLMSVVEGGSMNKAAERLATSQPAVSRAISDLEHSLGVRLLDRSPQGVVPTPYGRALIKRAAVAFDELRLGIEDLESLADPTVGEVRIAAPIILATGFVAATIDKLARRHPGIVCHVAIDDGSQRFRRLEEREVDLEIAMLTWPVAEECMDTEILYTDRLIVVAATDNPVSRRRSIKLADLMNEPWSLPPPNGAIGRAFADAFRKAGLDLPPATHVCSSGVARTAVVAEGRFLTITVESVLRFVAKDMPVKALPIDLTVSPMSMGIVTLKSRTLTAAAQLFIECAREVAKPLTTARNTPARRQRH